MLNNLQQMHLNQFKRVIQKIANRIKKIAKTLQKTVTNKNDKEMPKERYMSAEERQKIIDGLRSI